MCRRLSLSLALVLWWASIVQAQLVVVDPTNLVQNSITAVESVLTTIEEFLIEAQGVLNLTALSSGTAAMGTILEDMQLMAEIIQQAEGLSYDIGSLEAQINALFGLDLAPATSSELAIRLAEIRRVRQQAYSYATRVQTLLKTAIRTIEHMNALLDNVSTLIGNLAGHQLQPQSVAGLQKHLSMLHVETTAFHRAQSIDKLEELVTIESLHRINCRVYERDC